MPEDTEWFTSKTYKIFPYFDQVLARVKHYLPVVESDLIS